MRTMAGFLLLAALGLGAPAALPAPASAQEAALVPYSDDGDRESLLAALAHTQRYLEGLKSPAVKLAGREVAVSALLASCRRFGELVTAHWGTPELAEAVTREFEQVPMAGGDGQGTVHFTGYHLPLLEAREKPDATYRFPLYAPPADMLRVELGAFRPELAGQSAAGRLEGGRVVPYYTRADIDDARALEGRGLEIAWVADEMARYGLMVQGSGMLRFEGGRIVNVNYAAQNGHPYRSLGKALVADGKIPQALISMPAIEAYFKAHPDELRPYLNRNPSYVFFRLAPAGPYGSSGMTLTPGRAIATDKRHYPAGAIAWLEYPRARFDAAGQLAGWERGGRFVVDQDTGGAILGPGRVDIYWGGGEEAARRAGTLNGNGRACYLLLKSPDVTIRKSGGGTEGDRVE